MFRELIAHGRAFEIEFNRMRPGAAGLGDEAGGGVDVAGGANRGKDIRLGQMIKKCVHLIRHLAKPDDIGSRGGGVAGGAGIARCHDHGRRPAVIAGGAERAFEGTMHVHHLSRAALFVQIIDILGDDDHLAVKLGL